MVGDRSHDVEGAAEHGIDTVVVGWGYGADDFLEASAAAAHVATMPALRRSSVSDVLRDVRVHGKHLPITDGREDVRPPDLPNADWRASSGSPAPEPADGTSATAPTNANRVLRRHGYPTDHRAAQVGDDHLAAHLVVALGRNHLRMLGELGVEPGRLRMLRSFDPRSGAHALDVEDPTTATLSPTSKTYTVIGAALPGLHAWVDEQLAAHEGRAG